MKKLIFCLTLLVTNFYVALSQNSPILGAIVHSTLNPKEFRLANNDGWVLCDDGTDLLSVVKGPGTRLNIAELNSAKLQTELGKIHPTFILPDLRGQFIRTLDSKGAVIPTEKDRVVNEKKGWTTAKPRDLEIKTEPAGEHSHNLINPKHGPTGGGCFFIAGNACGGPGVAIPEKNRLTNTEPDHSHIVTTKRWDRETSPVNIALYTYIYVGLSKP